MTDSASSTALLSFRGVTRRYQAGREWFHILHNVSFDIQPGDFVGLHGERRSGKSTLLRVAAGWEQPDEGVVNFNGFDLKRISRSMRARLMRAGGIGLTSGMWCPGSNKPVISHVTDVLLCARVSPREAVAPALRALEEVGLGDRAHMPSKLLSHGEMIRLGLAQRLVHKPRLLLVDEPAVRLRPRESDELYELLARLGQDLGLALVIASEDLAPIRMARRIMSLDDGRLRVMSIEDDDALATVVDFPDRRASSGLQS